MREAYARKNFASPDDVIEVRGVRSELVDLGGVTLAKDIHQPGWRWSPHARPVVGTEWCETRHIGLVLQGRAHVLTREGVEFDLMEGDVVDGAAPIWQARRGFISRTEASTNSGGWATGSAFSPPPMAGRPPWHSRHGEPGS